MNQLKLQNVGFFGPKMVDPNGDFHLEAIILYVSLALAPVFQDLAPSPWARELRGSCLGR